MGSWLTDEEIVMMYRQARDKENQIIVLSELTLLSEKRIRSILFANGFTECATSVTKRKRARAARFPWSPEELELLVKVMETSASWKEVATYFTGRTTKAIYSFAKNHGLVLGESREFIGEIRRKVWTEEIRQKCFDMAREGRTYAEIAAEVNSTVPCVRAMFREARKKDVNTPNVVDCRKRENR